MKRLTFAAAAFAAGTTTFAVHAQEAPVTALGAVAPAIAAEEGKADAKSNAATGYEFRIGRDNGSGPGIDPTTTSSLAAEEAPRVKPRIKAIARKKSIGLPEVEKTRPAALASSGSSGSYDTIITRYAASYGIPASLAHAVIRVESNYRPGARGSAGEIGLMQIKPATARMMGYRGTAKGLYDPETNIKFGMKYLAMAHDLGGGTTCGTILRYNAGHAARRMNPVSAAYCSKVKIHLAGG